MVLQLKDGYKIPVKLQLKENGEYTIEIGHPIISSLLLRIAKFFSPQSIYELANLWKKFQQRKTKEEDMQKLCKEIIGSARSMKMRL